MSESSFKHSFPLQLRFNDMDMLGHVNNSVYFSFYDLGKAHYFESVCQCHIDWLSADIVIANVNTDFLSPVFYDEQVAVQTAVVEIGNKSLKLRQQIVNTLTGQIKSRCETIMVGFDPQTLTAKEITQEWRIAINKYEGRDLSRVS